MNFKLIVTLSVLLFSSIIVQASVDPIPMKFAAGQSYADKHDNSTAVDFDLNYTVPDDYLNWNFELFNTNTNVTYYFSTDGINSIGVLGYIPPGHYQVQISSSYSSSPSHYFEYYSCWGANLLGYSHMPAAYYIDLTDTCNELMVTKEF